METFVFWVSGSFAVLGAVGLILSRKAVYGALWVAFAMINLAVLYIANSAPFLGLVQIIVYTGAVMMLFLFVLMIVGVDASDSFIETIKGQRLAAILLSLGLGVVLVAAVGSALVGIPAAGLEQANAADGGNVEGIARLLFTDYLIAFEVTSALLITAALGAMVLAHRESWSQKVTQPMLSRLRFQQYAQTGAHPGNLPASGTFARHNAIGTPALLPDGAVSDRSIPGALKARGAVQSVPTDDIEQIEALASEENAQ